MSLVTLSIAFIALTLVIVAVLVCYLRRRAAESRQAVREQAEDAPRLAVKVEE